VRLHTLEPDPATAPIVQRIFTDFLGGYGYLAIAERLTAEHLLPPSGHDGARNPHRLGLAWSKSAVRAILANPRYTGYQVWNKQRRDEVLLDVDVAAGHVSSMRWNPPDQWVWSAQPTHPALVSREAFDQVQARIASRSPTSPRGPKPSAKSYLLRGRLTCGLCRRRLQGQWVRGEAYYRCRYPAEYAASAQPNHPTNVYLREADLLAKIDGWLNRLVSPANIEATCRALAAAHATPAPPARHSCGPPSRPWPTASASWPATGRRWRPAATPQWSTSGSPRSPSSGLRPSAGCASFAPRAGRILTWPRCGRCWRRSVTWPPGWRWPIRRSGRCSIRSWGSAACTSRPAGW
jgi:Recombinase